MQKTHLVRHCDGFTIALDFQTVSFQFSSPIVVHGLDLSWSRLELQYLFTHELCEKPLMCVLFSTRIRLLLCIRIVAAQREKKNKPIISEILLLYYKRTVDIENRRRFAKRTRVTVAVSVHRAETMLFKNEISCSNFTDTGSVWNISNIVWSRCCFKKLRKKPNILVFKRVITFRHYQLVSTSKNIFYNLTFDNSIVCILLFCNFSR